MISLTDLQHRFGFTRSEVVVILFLSASLLAGAGIRWVRSGALSGGEAVPAFDYTAADSEFTARSGAPPAETPAAGAPPGTFPHKPSPPAAPIDINSASAAELVRLPGIGEAFARRILAERERAGRFSRVDDLLRVSGIGPKKLEALRRYVTVR